MALVTIRPQNDNTVIHKTVDKTLLIPRKALLYRYFHWGRGEGAGRKYSPGTIIDRYTFPFQICLYSSHRNNLAHFIGD